MEAENIKDDKIAMLLTFCSDCPELYNEVGNILYKLFETNIGAELNLVCTYVVKKVLEGGGCYVL